MANCYARTMAMQLRCRRVERTHRNMSPESFASKKVFPDVHASFHSAVIGLGRGQRLGNGSLTYALRCRSSCVGSATVPLKPLGTKSRPAPLGHSQVPGRPRGRTETQREGRSRAIPRFLQLFSLIFDAGNPARSEVPTVSGHWRTPMHF